MQYILCPRCKFRVPHTKHICGTCGYVIASAPGTKKDAADYSAVAKPQSGGFWARFFGLETQQDEHKEPGHEEPALG